MLAAIDVGSNTLRLLVGRVVAGRVVPEHCQRQICRLAGGFSQEEGLSSTAMERTLSALQTFAETCRQNNVSEVKAIGTAAFRMATNGQSFARQINNLIQFPFEIISGEKEAAYTARGVLSALDPTPHCVLIVDIGGGSTEFVLCSKREVLWSRSLPLGVVRLVEAHASLPSLQIQIEQMIAELKEELDSVCRSAGFELIRIPLVGTAGTATTLAALDLHMTKYNWQRINNYVLPFPRLQYWQRCLAPLSRTAREALPGMESGRGDLITAGLEIILCLMRHTHSEALTVCDSGLLEGLLLSLQNSVKL